MKIAFIGTHGTGKTTLSYGLAEWFSKNGHHVDIVKEVAANSLLPINEESTLGAQLRILKLQMADEILASERYKHVISDRSVIDNYIYLIRKFGPHPIEKYILDKWVQTYDFHFYVPIQFKLIGTNIRASDIHFQEEIDKLLLYFLKKKKIPHYKLNKDIDFLTQVKKIIRKHSNEKFPYN